MNKVILFGLIMAAQVNFGQNVFPTSGYVGIGTTTPGFSPLHIKSTNDAILALQTTDDRWLYTQYLNTAGTRKSWIGLGYDLSSFNITVENGTDKILFNGGNVGIGAVAPSAKLEVTSPAVVGQEVLFKLNVSDAPQDYIRISNMTGGDGQFIPAVQGYHVTDNRAALYLTGVIESNNDIGVEPITIFDSRLSNVAVTTRPLFSWDSYGTKKMVLNANGSLGIGTTTTGTHKLAVEGSIAAREIKVLASGWADFVFKKEYDLPTLEQVEKHINEKGHLENIPNEEEVLKNGIYLGEMNTKLLQKIEELTLYMIQQNKQITELQNRLEKVESNSK